jgi:APA family basic amino acid/polyamine antiporter
MDASNGRAVKVPEPGLVKGLGLLDATTLVMGSMIGSGIFIVAADIATQLKSPGLMMMTWVVTAVLTIIAALSYGELAAAMPKAGGQYVYLREAYGPLWGFLFGWTLFLVIQTGTIAAVAVAFAKFAGIYLPWISTQAHWGPFNTQQLVAIAMLVLLTAVNTRGVRTGAMVQNVFTIAKVASLLALVGFGLALGRNTEAVARNFPHFWENASWGWTTIRVVGVAMVGALFSADAWNNVTFTAGEVRNPKRNLPLSLVLGVGTVCLLYIACNLVYLNVLPLEAIQQAPEQRVATAVAGVILGPMAVKLMAAAIMVSTFGCLNGIILAGARVYYAMALDGLFFRAVGRLDRVHHTPVVSLVVQCIWGSLLVLSGTYSDLLDYVIFAVLLFYILTIAGVFVLRRTQPDLERPYRAFGYPVLPAIYIAVAGLIEVLLLLYKPSNTWPGLIIVLLGIPVYYIWRRGRQAREIEEEDEV